MKQKNLIFNKLYWLVPLTIIITYIVTMYISSNGISLSIVHFVEKYYDMEVTNFPSKSKNLLSSLMNFLVYIAVVIPILFVALHILIIDYKRKKEDRTFGSKIALFIGIFYATSVLVGIIARLIYESDSTNQEAITSILKANGLSTIMMIIAAVIIGPVVEELVFRFSIFELIKNKWIAFPVSAVLFGLIHVLSSNVSFIQMIALLLPYSASGVVFALAYEKSNRNIWLPITIHSITNLASVVITLLL